MGNGLFKSSLRLLYLGPGWREKFMHWFLQQFLSLSPCWAFLSLPPFLTRKPAFFYFGVPLKDGPVHQGWDLITLISSCTVLCTLSWAIQKLDKHWSHKDLGLVCEDRAVTVPIPEPLYFSLSMYIFFISKQSDRTDSRVLCLFPLLFPSPWHGCLTEVSAWSSQL